MQKCDSPGPNSAVKLYIMFNADCCTVTYTPECCLGVMSQHIVRDVMIKGHSHIRPFKSCDHQDLRDCDDTFNACIPRQKFGRFCVA